MKVEQLQGEPTRFHVESNSLQCAKCERLFNRRERRYKALLPDDDCPHPECGAEEALRQRWHLVDLAMYHPVGQCSCESFSMHLIKQVERLSPAALAKLSHNEQDALRCIHINPARQYALNLTVAQYERERVKGRI